MLYVKHLTTKKETLPSILLNPLISGINEKLLWTHGTRTYEEELCRIFTWVMVIVWCCSGCIKKHFYCIFTAHQRSCWKVMFLVCLSVCPRGGHMWPIPGPESTMFPWGPSAPPYLHTEPQDMFKLVHLDLTIQEFCNSPAANVMESGRLAFDWSLRNMFLLRTTLVDLRGYRGYPHLGPNYFIFTQFSAKILSNNRLVHPLRELAPLSVKSWIRHLTILEKVWKKSSSTISFQLRLHKIFFLLSSLSPRV